MASEKETVADIVNEMRDVVYPVSRCPDLAMRGYADRIEAAHKRECESFQCEVADLRRRLKVAEDALETIANCDTDGIVLNFEETQIVNGHDLAIKAVDAVDEARSALAAIRGEGVSNGK